MAQVAAYALDKDSLRAGETLSVTVYWQPEAISERPMTVFVQLYAAAAGAIAQVDTYPLQGQYPTTSWVFEHAFAYTYQLTVPADFTSSREAEIVVGLYDPQTLQRVPVSGPTLKMIKPGSLRQDPRQSLMRTPSSRGNFVICGCVGDI